ncbi:alpha/beta hydrolase [Litoribacillus peritrichatus]|uniref:AB hydrolase-1 domain-containing protein n=1 Tax=Litoribacillus peritrichatus TaxID=718191 RepID=A0ABP7MEY0_9GAMM
MNNSETFTLKTIKKLGVMSCLLASTTASFGAQTQEKPTLVFVHGAHFTASSWQQVQTELKDTYPSVAVNLPGRNDKIIPNQVSMELSAGSLCQSLGQISGDKVLVAHSQGGAIVNAALNICPKENIEKIVYVTSVAPLDGEDVFAKLSKADEEHYFQGIRFNEQMELLEISDSEKFANNFAQDASGEQRKWLINSAVAEPAPVGGSKIKLNQQRFDDIEKHYVFAKRDQIISIESQNKIADSLKLKSTFTINSGHLPMLTQSKELANILVQVSSN